MNSILLIVVTLIFSAFFSGMEMAFISANKLRVELDKKQGLFPSGIITFFYDRPSQFITTMLVGNNVALVIYGTAMANLIEPAIRLLSQNDALVLLIQTLISTSLILVTAEFLPKAVFRGIANVSLNVMSVPLMVIFILLFPLTIFINWLSDMFINALRGKNEEFRPERPIFNKLDLVHFLAESADGEPENNPEENELKLFQNALDFSSVRVRDCMVPRNEITAIEVNEPVEKLKQLFIHSSFSKILAFENDTDNIIGYITSKSMFSKPNNIRDSLIDIIYVPETMGANKLLKKFIFEKRSIAVVVDEFGGVSGMLTIEDIIEEIFGEIEDEFDSPELIHRQLSEHTYLFSGRLEIDFINDKYNLKIPKLEEYDTIAGFIIHHYESIPQANETIEIGDLEIKILKVSKTKIDLIRLTLL